MQPQRVVLHVLRRADQPPLLGIPRGEHDRALRPMPARTASATARAASSTLTVPLTLSAAPGPHASRCAADDHQLVGKLAAAHDAEGVVDRLRAAASRGRRSRGRARAPGPGRRDSGTGARPAIAAGTSRPRSPSSSSLALPYEIGTTGMRGMSIRRSASRGALARARVARRGRIAVAVEHAAALHAVPVAHRPLGIDVAAHVAVVLRIAVDEQRHGAVPLRLARLDAAERAAVARDGDPALAPRRRASRAARSPRSARSSRTRPRRSTSPAPL